MSTHSDTQTLAQQHLLRFAESKTAADYRDYVSLLKPSVISLVVFTGLIGMLIAPNSLHPLLAFTTVLCIAVGAGAAGAINMWYDRDIDAIMTRTQKRPIPSGRVTPDDALFFGVSLSVFSVMILGMAVNWLAGGMLAVSILFYVFVYTMWLKRRTPQNIVIGGAAGAFPPVIGWLAATGEMTLTPWLLFLIIFLWTPPHFWALSLYRNEDYRRANVPMLPVVKGLPHTRMQIVIYSILLVMSSLALFFTNAAGYFYLGSALLLGGKFLHLVNKVFIEKTDVTAKRLFGFSILYLFALFSALGVDRALDALL